MVVAEKKLSVSHFEREVPGGKRPLRLAFRAREGVGDCEKPSVLGFEQGRVVVTAKNPPSRVSSERGRYPSILCFEQTEKTLRLRFRVREDWW